MRTAVMYEDVDALKDYSKCVNRPVQTDISPITDDTVHTYATLCDSHIKVHAAHDHDSETENARTVILNVFSRLLLKE